MCKCVRARADLGSRDRGTRGGENKEGRGRARKGGGGGFEVLKLEKLKIIVALDHRLIIETVRCYGRSEFH